MTRKFALILAVLVAGSTSACVSISKPCLSGGQPARSEPFKGKRRCDQHKDQASGRYLNHGAYEEWHPNGIRALEGEYKNGLKTGKWREWDDKGKQLYEKWFDEGNETVPVRPIGPTPSKPKGSDFLKN